jgi:hypothetical protein
MFSHDTVMKRTSKSTLKLWRKQAREKVLGRESRGRKACPAFETALLSELLYVWCRRLIEQYVNGVFSPLSSPFFVK